MRCSTAVQCSTVQQLSAVRYLFSLSERSLVAVLMASISRWESSLWWEGARDRGREKGWTGIGRRGGERDEGVERG